MKRFKGCLGVFVVFFLGLIIGVLLASFGIYKEVWGLVEGGPDRVAEYLIRRMNEDLQLDSVQKREFERIADRTRLKLRTTRHQTGPEVRAILDEATAEIRGILTPAQQKKFDQAMKQFRERWLSSEETSELDSTAKPVESPTPPAADPTPPTPEPAEQEKPALEQPAPAPAPQD